MKLFPIRRSTGTLSTDTRQNLHSLLNIMNSKTKEVISPNGCGFTTTYVTGGILKENNNTVYNHHGLAGKSTSSVSINGKMYTINTETGEVIPEEFSWKNLLFGTSKKLIKSISDTINRVKENFENRQIVQPRILEISGFTQKGVERLREAQERAQRKARTKAMIKTKW